MIAVLLAAAGTIAYLDLVVISNVVKEIQDELHLSDLQAGWVLAAFLIGYGTLQVPLGRLADLRGIRFALPTIVVLWSLMTGLTPVAQTFALMFAVRCAFGMEQAGSVSAVGASGAPLVCVGGSGHGPGADHFGDTRGSDPGHARRSGH